MKLTIEGGEPLKGKVAVSGSRNASFPIIAASLFANEPVTLENVPKVGDVLTDLSIIERLGAKVAWSSDGRLEIDASGLSSFEVPKDPGCLSRTSLLLTGPLLYRFGKAVVPKLAPRSFGTRPINRWLSTWEALGFGVSEDVNHYYIEAKTPQNSDVSFKISTVTGTENAILSSVFVPGETIISRAACEPEVDDLISFLQAVGASVKRVDDSKVIVSGGQFFCGAKYRLMPDKIEAASYATAALVTYGDVEISGVVSSHILPFIRKLEAIGASFEFRGDVLRVWRSKGDVFRPINVETGPAPGFCTDWLPLIVLLLTSVQGVSLVHDTIFVNRFDYVKDLNRMGARIALMRPSDAGVQAAIGDDSYDIQKEGEPYTLARIEGPTILKRDRLEISDIRSGAVLLLAALAAEGKSDIYGAENLSVGFENIIDKMLSLRASMETSS